MGKRKEITSKDNGKQKMWIIITVIIVFFAMAGYAGMSYYYSDRFFRGTTINGINCSGKTSEEAEQAVAKKAEDYLLEVKARNLKSQSINGKLIGYRYVSDGSISQYLDEQKPYKWVRGFWKKQNYTAKENMTYDKVKLKEQMEKLECVKKENQTAPEDAYVAYKDSKFEIVPETEGNETVAAYDGEEAQRLLLWHEDADMAVVDIMLPGKDGFALMEDFKKKDIPVLYLTAKDDVASKVKGLKLGAEDYMVKPFEMLELLVRIEKVLERTGRAKKVLTVRNILVDMQSHQVYKDGLPVSLKPMEYDLFVLLLQNKNIALGREELLKRVWGEDYLGESRTVDVHIGQLRKKLELYDEIRTIPKLGYRLEE